MKIDWAISSVESVVCELGDEKEEIHWEGIKKDIEDGKKISTEDFNAIVGVKDKYINDGQYISKDNEKAVKDVKDAFATIEKLIVTPDNKYVELENIKNLEESIKKAKIDFILKQYHSSPSAVFEIISYKINTKDDVEKSIKEFLEEADKYVISGIFDVIENLTGRKKYSNRKK